MDLSGFRSLVTETAADNQDAHNTVAVADYSFSEETGVNAVITALADAFYEAAVDQWADA